MGFIFSLLFILIIGLKTSNAQDLLFSVQLTAGINYSFTTYSGIYSFPEIDRKQPGANAALTVKYFIDSSNILLLGIEFIESKIITENNYSKAEWILRGYPVSLGYQYNFLHSFSSLYPYISINFNYYLSEVQVSYTNISNDFLDDRYDYKRMENGLGFDGNLGLSYRFSEKIEFITEFKLRYTDASVFTNHSTIEFSGVYLNAGLNYKI
jgi:hypothetical protein